MKRITGKRVSPVGLLFAILLVSMFFSAGVFAADVQVNGDATVGNVIETDAATSGTTTTTSVMGVDYRGHIQDIGNYPDNDVVWVQGPDQLGTTGECKRLEGFWIKLTGGTAIPAGASIRYNVHIENEGWLNDPDNLTDTSKWTANGEFAGSTAKSQRVEAIEIVLVGADGKTLPGYSVQYLVHGEDYGWSQGWKADGAIAGTTGHSLRLEAIQIKIVQVAATAYDKAGTYGPETGTEVVNNNVTVDADGVTLQNLHIKGDLTISEKVGDGTVNLNNVTVDGQTHVRGGGEHSIHINGGSYNNITVEKTASGNVRIVATDAAGADVVISDNAEGQDIILEGSFDSVTIQAPDVSVKTQGDTTVKDMSVGTEATGCEINLDTKTKVGNMVLDSGADIKGKGTIANANVNADGVKFEQAPDKQTVDPKVVTQPVVTPVNPPSSGGSSDSGYYSIPLTSIGAISGTPCAGNLLTAGTLLPAGATVTYQWKQSADGVTYMDIPGATSSTYAVDYAYADKYIKVAATGTGYYYGTVTSDATEKVVRIEAGLINYDDSSALGSVSQTVTLTGSTFADAAASENLKNWSINTGTTNLQVSKITRTGDQMVTIDYTMKVPGQGTGAGTLSVQAKAAAVMSGVESNTSGFSIAQPLPLIGIGAITGTPQVGEVLSAGPPDPLSARFSLQWQICNTTDGTYTNINQAQGGQYTPVAADVGKFIRVTAADANDTVASQPVGPIIAREEPKAIKSVADKNITVLNQTDLNGAKAALGTGITVILADDSTAVVPISWNEPTTTAYDGTKPGTYEFTSTFGTLPIGVTNDNNVAAPKATVRVNTVQTIKSAGNVTGQVSYGTDLSGATVALGSQVQVTLADDTTTMLPVTWSDTTTPSYVGTKPGTYEFTGTFGTLPAGVTYDDKQVAAPKGIITVSGTKNIKSVASITKTIGNGGDLSFAQFMLGSTFNVTLDDDSVVNITNMAVTWECATTYNGLIPGPYTFTGTFTSLPVGITNSQVIKAIATVTVADPLIAANPGDYVRFIDTHSGNIFCSQVTSINLVGLPPAASEYLFKVFHPADLMVASEATLTVPVTASDSIIRITDVATGEIGYAPTAAGELSSVPVLTTAAGNVTVTMPASNGTYIIEEFSKDNIKTASGTSLLVHASGAGSMVRITDITTGATGYAPVAGGNLRPTVNAENALEETFIEAATVNLTVPISGGKYMVEEIAPQNAIIIN
ncbi:Ig-like domain-containing protein [Acetobacterium paludosum]|nr:Ig-like domain-containing protein [Acetobacterium paludosum]